MRNFPIMDPSIRALIELTNSLLAEDWTASQGDELMSSDDEADLLIAARRADQQEQRNNSFEQLLKKRSVITIKNTDELCCARALVTTKEYVDGDPDKQCKNLQQGRPIQERLAKLLHQEAGVPEGPCGHKELEQFQAFLGPQGYQIKVFEGHCGVKWFHNEMYDDAPKKLCLLKVNDHFHGIRSLPALLNRSYYCHQCSRGYNEENAENHNCIRQNCDKCRRKKGQCPDFKEKKASHYVLSGLRSILSRTGLFYRTQGKAV